MTKKEPVQFFKWMMTDNSELRSCQSLPDTRSPSVESWNTDMTTNWQTVTLTTAVKLHLSPLLQLWSHQLNSMLMRRINTIWREYN